MAVKDIIGAGIGFSPGSVKFIITRGLFGGTGAATTTPIGKRPRRKRRSRIWETEQEFKPNEPQPLFDAGISAEAVQAIQARLDRMDALQAQIEAAGTVNKALKRSLAVELARLKAEEDDEDDVETLLLS